MNYKRRKKYILVSLILILTNIIYGCKSKNEDKKNIEINNGSVAIENNGSYKTYNLNNGIYESIDKDYIITFYDSESKNYIFN